MKKTLLILMLIPFQLAFSQSYEWTNLIGGDGFDFPRSTAIDDDGNVYSTGFYREGNFTIGDSVLPFVDNMDSYFVKYDPSGEVLWYIPLYGAGLFDRTESINIDPVSGDVYLLSTIQNELMIGDQESIVVPAENYVDIILMKFTSGGTLLWYKLFGGNAIDLAYDITINNDEILMTGHFNDTLTLGDYTLFATSQEMFISSLDLEGNVNWAKQYGGSKSDRLYEIAVHENGDLAVCGYSNGYWQFGDTQLDSIDGLVQYSFIGRLDDEGNPIWAAQSFSPVSTEADFITTDDQGNTYISYKDFSYDKFQIAKYNADGEVIWDYSSSNSADTLTALANTLIYKNGKLFIHGFLSKGNNLFGTNYDDIENTDYVLAIVNPDGSLDTLFHDGGPGKTYGRVMDIDDSGYATFSIVVNGPVNVNNTDLGVASNDILIVKLNINDLVTSIQENASLSQNISLYPNPARESFIIDNRSTADFSKIEVYNHLGMRVAEMNYQSKINTSEWSSGTYLVRLTGKGEVVTLKLIIE